MIGRTERRGEMRVRKGWRMVEGPQRKEERSAAILIIIYGLTKLATVS